MLRNTIAEAEASLKKNGRKTVYVQNERLADIPPVGKPNPYVNPNAAYAPTVQQSLFEEEVSDADEINVREDGAAYKQVPLIITKVYEDKPLTQEEASAELNKQVQRLYEQGLEIEEIAAKLSCSISEVQFIIDLLGI